MWREGQGGEMNLRYEDLIERHEVRVGGMWTGVGEAEELSQFGEVVFDYWDNRIPVDQTVARILNWADAGYPDGRRLLPAGADGMRYRLVGIVKDENRPGGFLAVFAFSKNLAIDDGVRYFRGMEISAEVAGNVPRWVERQLDLRRAAAKKAEVARNIRRWVERQLDIRRAAAEKADKIRMLLEEHGLDEKTVAAQRQKLLKEHGLD
ncbi:MAG: hypothetical protein ABIJ46_04065 [bacterium]